MQKTLIYHHLCILLNFIHLLSNLKNHCLPHMPSPTTPNTLQILSGQGRSWVWKEEKTNRSERRHWEKAETASKGTFFLSFSVRAQTSVNKYLRSNNHFQGASLVAQW